MKTIRLTRKAADSLDEILYWTLANFGPAQADKYKNDLMARVKCLAAGEPPPGRSLHSLLDNVSGSDSLNYYLVGRHLIIYLDTPELFVVTDFIHAGRDLEKLLSSVSS